MVIEFHLHVEEIVFYIVVGFILGLSISWSYVVPKNGSSSEDFKDRETNPSIVKYNFLSFKAKTFGVDLLKTTSSFIIIF